MKARTFSTPTLIIAAVLALTGCKKEDNDVEAREFKVRMTDSPGDYKALNVSVLSVDAYHEDGAWVNISNETQAVDVLNLTNGEEKIIAQKDIRSGMYSKLRIVFSQDATVSVTEADGLGSSTVIATHDLHWSGNKEVIINIAQKISATNGANVLVDFNVAASITETDGEYYIAPVVNVITDEATGVKGDVDGSAHAVVMLVGNGKTISTYTDASGNFLMRGVEAGTYTLIAIPEIEGVLDEGVEFNLEVVIDKGTIKNVGTINL